MNFLEKRNKMAILQERARLYNAVEDNLLEQIPQDQLTHEILQQHTLPVLDQHTSAYQTNANTAQNPLSKTFPKPQVSILTTSALLSLGLDNYAKLTTSSQDFNATAEQMYAHYKQLKQQGQLNAIIEPLQKQKKEDQETQAIIFKADHLKDYETKTHVGFKDAKSQYRRDHLHDSAMQELCDQPKMKHHLMKNDLNVFFDAYLKHKSTLRGVPSKAARTK